MIFLIALRNLLRHRRRTLLLGGALAMVAAVLTLMGGVSAGARERLFHAATTLNTGYVNVDGFYKLNPETSTILIVDAPKVLDVIRRTVPEATGIYPRGRGLSKMVHGNSSMLQVITGVDLKAEPQFGADLPMKEGSIQGLAEPSTLVLFADQAERLGVSVGDYVTLMAPTFRGANNTVDARLVGIVRNIGALGEFTSIISIDAERKLHAVSDRSVSAFQIYFQDVESFPAVEARLRTALTQAGYTLLPASSKDYSDKFDDINRQEWTGQRLDISNWENEVSSSTWPLQVITAVSVVLTLVMLLIVCIGVMNTFWIAIRERTREVGTMRAMGMRRRSVLAMFVVEGVLLELFSTAVGIAVALLVGFVINHLKLPLPGGAEVILMSDRLSLQFVASSLVSTLVVMTLCVTFVSLFPAAVASRLRPVVAMSW